ncbi:MAG TPA: universal stress protein [Solirubrobacteraceae bacterium]|nr:universal stress protein [Solirubrobacteraceae bacterium]
MDDHAESPTALLCFDGSDDAAAAIAAAGRLLGPGRAVVLSVWEPVRVWEPWDPVTVLSAPLERLVARSTGFDEIVEAIARDKAGHGVALARAAGFDAEPRAVRGGIWETICRVADELEAEPIVLGSRGVGRARSVLLGSVSQAVIAHTARTVLVRGCHPHRAAGAEPAG